MQLSSKLIKNLESVNSWQYADNLTISKSGNQGEATTLNFQIIDLDRDGIRYIPSNVATLQVTFPSLNDAAEISVAAVVPYADDRSIWQVNLLSTQIPQTSNIYFALTDGGVTRRFSITNALRIRDVNQGAC